MSIEATGMATPAHATEQDLWNAPDDGYRRELVNGEIRVMSPAGFRHGEVGAKLAARLVAFVEQRRLGHVLDSSTGFRLPNGNVRVPDVAFVAFGRVDDERTPEGFGPVAPDLAVEVLSPDDRPREILDKVGEYLDAGVRLVWIVDPASRVATVYRSPTDVRRLGELESLDGEDVVPGFRCPLADVLVP